jgi:hypothetical protein
MLRLLVLPKCRVSEVSRSNRPSHCYRPWLVGAYLTQSRLSRMSEMGSSYAFGTTPIYILKQKHSIFECRGLSLRAMGLT